MTPTLTIALMLAVTLGAALYVAWPLLLGSVDPHDYLETEGPGLAPQPQRRYAGRELPRTGERNGVPPRGAAASTSRLDLDIEQEIEEFRRKGRSAQARGSLTCPSCGKSVKDPEAAFCSKCGAPIRKSSAKKK